MNVRCWLSQLSAQVLLVDIPHFSFSITLDEVGFDLDTGCCSSKLKGDTTGVAGGDAALQLWHHAVQQFEPQRLSDADSLESTGVSPYAQIFRS